MADLDVTRNEAESRYEATRDGATAVIEFRRRDVDGTGVVDMTHTEVPKAMRGGGVGGELVRQALDDVRSRGEKVRPSCPFVASWIEDHEDYADLVAR